MVARTETRTGSRWSAQPRTGLGLPVGNKSEEKIVAVPKRKMSRSNTRSRRAQWKTSVVPTVTCVNPACREPHLSHTACPSCGQYGPKGARRQVVEA